jgi:leucyl aminopeptidase
MHYLSKLKAKQKHRYVAVIPLVENVVSNVSYKPGDILTSYNGKTVEIKNTDAEGRLILADALAYACDKYDQNLKLIIDIATLTGWSSRLHCDIDYSYFTMNTSLASRIEDLQATTGERNMRIPPWIEYRKKTYSKVADYMNAVYPDCPYSDGFMASMFLSNFIPETFLDKWLHMDIANNYNASKDTIRCNGMMTLLELVSSLS